MAGTITPIFSCKGSLPNKKFALHIVPALQELIGGRATEMLPTLQNIFLEASGPVQDSIEQFVATRQIASRPIAVSHWENSEHDKTGIALFLPVGGGSSDRLR